MAGLKPRFVTGEPSSDADIAAVVQTIGRRVIHKLRSLGYLEADSAAAVVRRLVGDVHAAQVPLTP